MKKVLLICLALVCGLTAFAYLDSGSTCSPFKPVPESRLAFKAGEKLTYSLHYKWGMVDSDVAQGEITTHKDTLNGKELFFSRIFGKTAKFYDAFFKVREDFCSWYTIDALEPVKFTRDSQEGGYFAKNTFFYQPGDTTAKVIVSQVETKKKPLHTVEIPVDECTTDIPAAFFRTRSIDFSQVKEGDSFDIHFAIHKETYSIRLTFLRRENKYIKNVGNFRTMRFSMNLVKCDVFSGEDMTLWVTDDENKIPLQFTAPIKIGTVSGRLTGYEGLAHPLTSFIRRKK